MVCFILMSTLDIIKAAVVTLDEALAADRPTLLLSVQAKAWLLGQVWGESRFGSTRDWGTSNNWGAVTYHLRDGKFIEHADHSADGKPVVYKFQAYDTQLEAARAWLKVILRGNVPSALLHGTVRDLAAAMYANRYYTGINTDTDRDGLSGTANDRIMAYEALIRNNAAFITSTLASAKAIEDFGVDLSTVAGVQETLRRLGHDPGKVDGISGLKTRAAVVAFQRARGLVADGIVGPVTRSALLSALEQAA